MEAPRPAWGCLDAREMQEAAAGETAEPAIREHLAGCRDCWAAVRELRGVVGQPTGYHARRYRRSLLARPGFWLLLIVLGGLAYGFWRWDRSQPAAVVQPTTAEAAPPVTTPPPRPRVRRPRPPRSGAGAAPASTASTNDAAIVDVIRKNQTGVRMCYERSLKRDPLQSQLRLDVRLNVSAAGLVDRVSLAGLPDSSMLSNCIRNTIRTWKFPPGTAAYETAFPLHLHQGQ